MEKELATKLEDVQTLQGKLEKDYDLDSLPPVIQDRVSEARVLQQTLPNELEGLRNYLQDARSLRERYFEAAEKLKAWIDEGEELLRQNANNEVNFEYVAFELDNHKVR